MKKFVEFLDNLSHAQAIILAVVSSLIFTTIFAFFQPNFDVINDINLNKLQLLIIVAVIFAVITYLLLLVGYILPRKNIEQMEKEYENAKEEVLANYNLSKENYIEVKFIFEKFLEDVDEDITEAILPILTHSNCRFCVKLIDSEEGDVIQLVCVDINTNIIYTTTIYNFIFFQKYFEKVD